MSRVPDRVVIEGARPAPRRRVYPGTSSRERRLGRLSDLCQQVYWCIVLCDGDADIDTLTELTQSGVTQALTELEKLGMVEHRGGRYRATRDTVLKSTRPMGGRNGQAL